MRLRSSSHATPLIVTSKAVIVSWSSIEISAHLKDCGSWLRQSYFWQNFLWYLRIRTFIVGGCFVDALFILGDVPVFCDIFDSFCLYIIFNFPILPQVHPWWHTPCVMSIWSWGIESMFCFQWSCLVLYASSCLLGDYNFVRKFFPHHRVWYDQLSLRVLLSRAQFCFLGLRSDAFWRHNPIESRPRSITETITESICYRLTTYNVLRHLHSQRTTSRSVSDDACTRHVMCPVCFPFLFHSQRQRRIATTHCVAQDLEQMNSVRLHHRMSILRLCVVLNWLVCLSDWRCHLMKIICIPTLWVLSRIKGHTGLTFWLNVLITEDPLRIRRSRRKRKTRFYVIVMPEHNSHSLNIRETWQT